MCMGIHQATGDLTPCGCLQLLPLMWLGLTMLNFTVVILLKWALMQRLHPGAFAKYTWAFQTRAVSVGIQVCTASAGAPTSRQPVPHGSRGSCQTDFCCQESAHTAQSGTFGLLALTAHSSASKASCGVACPGTSVRSQRSPRVLQDRLVMTGLMEMGRASWWHTSFLRAMGARMGRGVFWDVSAFSVSN